MFIIKSPVQRNFVLQINFIVKVTIRSNPSGFQNRLGLYNERFSTTYMIIVDQIVGFGKSIELFNLLRVQRILKSAASTTNFKKSQRIIPKALWSTSEFVVSNSN